MGGRKPTRTAARIARLEATLREREERIFALEREGAELRMKLACTAAQADSDLREQHAVDWRRVEEARSCAAEANAQCVAAREQLDEARALLREWRNDFYATDVGERLRATERVLRAGVSVEPAKEGE